MQERPRWTIVRMSLFLSMVIAPSGCSSYPKETTESSGLLVESLRKAYAYRNEDKSYWSTRCKAQIDACRALFRQGVSTDSAVAWALNEYATPGQKRNIVDFCRTLKGDYDSYVGSFGDRILNSLADRQLELYKKNLRYDELWCFLSYFPEHGDSEKVKTDFLRQADRSEDIDSLRSFMRDFPSDRYAHIAETILMPPMDVNEEVRKTISDLMDPDVITRAYAAVHSRGQKYLPALAYLHHLCQDQTPLAWVPNGPSTTPAKEAQKAVESISPRGYPTIGLSENVIWNRTLKLQKREQRIAALERITVYRESWDVDRDRWQEALWRWYKGLASNSNNVRPADLWAFALVDPDSCVRQAAIQLSSQFKHPDATSLLLPRLRDNSDFVKAEAIHHLASSASADIQRELVMLLDDPHSGIRLLSAQRLKQMNWVPKDAYERNLLEFGFQNWEYMIAHFNSTASILFRALSDSDIQVRFGAIRSFSALSSEGKAYLQRAKERGSGTDRDIAGYTLDVVALRQEHSPAARALNPQQLFQKRIKQIRTALPDSSLFEELRRCMTQYLLTEFRNKYPDLESRNIIGEDHDSRTIFPIIGWFIADPLTYKQTGPLEQRRDANYPLFYACHRSHEAPNKLTAMCYFGSTERPEDGDLKYVELGPYYQSLCLAYINRYGIKDGSGATGGILFFLTDKGIETCSRSGRTLGHFEGVLLKELMNQNRIYESVFLVDVRNMPFLWFRRKAGIGEKLTDIHVDSGAYVRALANGKCPDSVEYFPVLADHDGTVAQVKGISGGLAISEVSKVSTDETVLLCDNLAACCLGQGDAFVKGDLVGIRKATDTIEANRKTQFWLDTIRTRDLWVNKVFK